MDHTQQYAAFLLSRHLSAFTELNLRLLRENQVPVLALLGHLDEQEIFSLTLDSLKEFLEQLAGGPGTGRAFASLEKWRNNQIQDIPRDEIRLEDIILVYSLRKQVMLQLLTLYADDVATYSHIAIELEAYFRQWQQAALQIYVQIHNEQMLQRNEALRVSEQNQAIINEALVDQIKKLKETQQALKDSQAIARLGHWEIDYRSGNQVTWSEALYRIYGIEDRQHQPLSLSQVTQLVHPADGAELQEKINRATGEDVSYEHEYRITRPDGQVRTLFSRGYVERDEAGTILKLKGISQDITERKAAEEEIQRQREELQTANEELLSQQEELQTMNEELQESHEELHAINEELREQIEIRTAIEENLKESERRFRLLADNSSDMISRHTPEGVFTYVSPACRALLGYTEAELTGKQVYDFFHPEDIPTIQEKHNEGLATPDTQTVTYRIRKQSGDYTWVESTGISIRDPQTGGVAELQVATRDISLRKQAEEHLERERGYLQSILEHITDGIMVCDADGVLSFFNETARQFYGAPEQPVPPDQWAAHYRLYHLDGMTPVQMEEMPLYRAYRGETVQNVEVMVIPANAPRKIVLTNGTRITAPNGRVLGAVVVMHDITGQKAAERELLALNYQLRENNEELVRTEDLLKELNSELEDKVRERTAALENSIGQFRFLADTVPQIIWTADAEGNVTYFNQNWYGYTGLSVDHSLDWEWQSALHPDDAPRTLQQWKHCLQTGELFSNEHRFRRAHDGAYRWHLARGVPMKDEHGTVSKWFGSCTDIQDQKLIQEELLEKNHTLALVNKVGLSLSAEFDINKIVQTVTDVTTELTGAQFGAFFYNVMDEKGEHLTLYSLSGVPREAFAKYPMPRSTQIFAPTFRGEGIMRSDDITQDPRYGNNSPYRGMPEGHLPVRSYLAVPVVSRSGEVIGGLFFGHSQAGVFKGQAEDIVRSIASQAAIAIDNSRMVDTLKEKNKELTRINTDLDNFMYTASHDLKAPIANLEALFSLLNRRMPKQIVESEQELFNLITQSVGKFNRTIRDLTQIASIQKDTEGQTQVSFREVLEDVQADVQQMIVESGAVIHVDFRVESLTIEKKNIRSVLYNLVTNAIKYRSPDRSPVIEISTAVQDRWTVLKVRDNGLGISPSQQSKLFMIFKRLHTHVDGSGIGLYMLKRIVENKGGHITVESEEGQGAAFSVFFRN